MTNTDAQLIQLVIAICKREVEKVVPPEVIHHLDQGSPWGRAFLEAMRVLKKEGN